MTDPVETLAQALWDAYTRSMHDLAAEAVAETFLAQITPALVAEAVAKEREACAKVAESAETPVFKDGWTPREDAAAISAMMSIAAAIRARMP